jgi:hypothetical protein
MTSTFKLRRSSTPGAAPTTAQLQLGELAMNTYDGKLYFKKNVSGTETVLQAALTRSVAAVNTSNVNAQGQCPLTADINVTTYTAGGYNSCTLPAATVGKVITVWDISGSGLNVYPASGDKFIGLLANASIDLTAAAGGSGGADFYCFQAGVWTAAMQINAVTGAPAFPHGISVTEGVVANGVQTPSVQLGNDGTATKNFVLQTNVDGTGKLARGNVGATTQDLVTWDASGVVRFPNTPMPIFRANRTATQSIAHNTATKVQLNAEDFDVGSYFDSTTNFRFQPSVAGYYHFDYGAYVDNGANDLQLLVTSLCKNGSQVYGSDLAEGSFFYTPTYIVTSAGSAGSTLIALNGSTDYVELFARAIRNTGTSNTLQRAFLAGHFVRPL